MDLCHKSSLDVGHQHYSFWSTSCSVKAAHLVELLRAFCQVAVKWRQLRWRNYNLLVPFYGNAVPSMVCFLFGALWKLWGELEVAEQNVSLGSVWSWAALPEGSGQVEDVREANIHHGLCLFYLNDTAGGGTAHSQFVTCLFMYINPVELSHTNVFCLLFLD